MSVLAQAGPQELSGQGSAMMFVSACNQFKHGTTCWNTVCCVNDSPGMWSVCGETVNQVTVLPNGQGVRQELSQGEKCQHEKSTENYLTTIEYHCQPGMGIGRPTSMFSSDPCKINIQWASQYACPVSYDVVVKKESGWGWHFVIIYFSVVILYFGGGAVYRKRTYQVEGFELLPHAEFWREFPDLVKTGAYYAYDKACAIGAAIAECIAGRQVYGYGALPTSEN
eukprot:CAMPEP_0114554352 /NCGR_PEP_ID=MMETSP0114-20121206/8168_1 /TAXON_ID=31324 /ORGANISM="Goniomonas sp, Strain m" /LENGTH=224 /DNA_ID=CAMNT_0001739401 /DNA_START=101 /DNA_END=775 /DNA_ORIENTATION=-